MRRLKVGSPFDLTCEVEAEGSCKRNGPRRVGVGKEFNGQAHVDAITRQRIATGVLALSTVFLIGAAALGLRRGDFGPLLAVCTVVGPAYGLMAPYFFGQRSKG